jgi:hypothetical protein
MSVPRKGFTGIDPAQRLQLLRSMKGSGKTFQLKTEGMSMFPLVRPDTVAEIHFRPPGRVRPGDIILFERAGGLILHRVLARSDEDGRLVFTEKGDHQPFAGLVSEGQYLAVAVRLRSGTRVFDPSTGRGRLLTRLILSVSRLELRLYKWKVRLFGRERSGAGRAFVNLSSAVRGALRRLIYPGGRGGPPARG